jgi:hypothetical protein
MRWTFRFAVAIGVACTVLASTVAPAQVRKPNVNTRQKAAQQVEVFKKEVMGELRALPAQRIVVNLNAQRDQSIQLLRPILNAEYQLICSVCAPRAEQRKQLAHDGERALRDTAQAYAEMRRSGVRVVLNRVQVANNSSVFDPRRMIHEKLLASLKAHCSPDDVARYEAEVAKREKDRKRIAILNLVARIDQEVILSTDQRDRLTRTLSLNWNDAWSPALELFQYNNTYPPSIPEDCIALVLDDEQLKIWRGVRKSTMMVWNGSSFMANMLAGDNPLEDDALREAQKAAQDPPEQE